MKTCFTCKTDKPETEYYTNSRSGKLNPSCKVCCRAYTKQNALKAEHKAHGPRLTGEQLRIECELALSEFGDRLHSTHFIRYANY